MRTQDVVAAWMERLWCWVWGPICPGAITIGISTAKHLIEGGVILCTDAADGSIGIAAMLSLVPERRALAVALLFCAGLSIWAQRGNWRSPTAVFLLLLPQQMFLASTCYGALSAVVHGVYADGALRSSTFILCDQIVRILLAPAYTWAIFARAGFVGKLCR